MLVYIATLIEKSVGLLNLLTALDILILKWIKIYLFIYLFTGINKAKPVKPDPMYVTNLC